MAEIRNFTGKLERAVAFIAAKCERFDTTGVSIHIKYTKAKGRDLNGYYRHSDRRIVIAVKRRLRYPRLASYAVGSRPLARPRLGKRPYALVCHEDCFDSAEDLLVFAAGHEVWHFVCHSGQRRGDHETKANCNGFLWLGEFKHWHGVNHEVTSIPALPPRPDLESVAAETCRPIQGQLFSNPAVRF